MRTFVAFRSTSCDAPAGGAAQRKETDSASAVREMLLELSRWGDTTREACAQITSSADQRPDLVIRSSPRGGSARGRMHPQARAQTMVSNEGGHHEKDPDRNRRLGFGPRGVRAR